MWRVMVDRDQSHRAGRRLVEWRKERCVEQDGKSLGELIRWGFLFFFSSRRRHTRFEWDWSSDVCSADLPLRLTYAAKPPTVVLMAGLQGSGKTTAVAKLGRWYKQRGRNPLLVGADLQRPAGVEQLRVLGQQAGVPVFSETAPTFGHGGGDPVRVAASGLEEAR